MILPFKKNNTSEHDGLETHPTWFSGTLNTLSTGVLELKQIDDNTDRGV